MGPLHGLKWIKFTTNYHVGGGVWVVMVWSRSWLIITKLDRCSFEHNSIKILSEHLEIPLASHFEPPPLLHSFSSFISMQILPQPKGVEGGKNSTSVMHGIEWFWPNLHFKIYQRKSRVNVQEEKRPGAYFIPSTRQSVSLSDSWELEMSCRILSEMVSDLIILELLLLCNMHQFLFLHSQLIRTLIFDMFTY